MCFLLNLKQPPVASLPERWPGSRSKCRKYPGAASFAPQHPRKFSGAQPRIGFAPKSAKLMARPGLRSYDLNDVKNRRNKPMQANTLRAPPDAEQRRAVSPVLVYDNGVLPPFDARFYQQARETSHKIGEIIVPPREGEAFRIPKGHFFRIVSVDGPQVGDLNLWNEHDMSEHFFSGKTRALHATHLTTGHRLWSTLPFMRPMATITNDTLGWYGWDQDGAGVHDVIGTRCDPYTNRLLRRSDYHHCCHSNLTRAIAAMTALSIGEAEWHVHDVLNVFMCTGFTRDTHQYFMKASPARPGDFIEFFAEMDLLAALSACPGGDCGQSHSSDNANCYPLKVEVFRAQPKALEHWREFERSDYSGGHGA